MIRFFTVESTDQQLALEGWSADGPGKWSAADGSGATCRLLSKPARRTWSADGVLLESSSPAAGGRSWDLVELDAPASGAWDADRSPTMLVLGSFSPLGGPADIGRFVVGGHVLDTTDFGGRRCPSEQTALALWRVCRLRGGPLWDGVADHVAAWVRDRIVGASEPGPVHDLWGKGETHVRFLADGALLLVAESERLGDDPRATAFAVAAERAFDLLDEFAVVSRFGRWYAHDSIELASGGCDLVLNTHAQVVAARHAWGHPDTEAIDALEASLSPARNGRGWLAAGALAASTLARRLAPRRLAAAAGMVDDRVRAAVSRHLATTQSLRLPGGYVGRDALVHVSPDYYLVTNLYDLGILGANGVSRAAADAARAGWRWAEATGSLRIFTDAAHPLSSLLPIVCRQLGKEDRAKAATVAVTRFGGLPVPGWPGFDDRPWAAFAADTA